MKKYKTIVIDPPWRYRTWGIGSNKSCYAKKHNLENILLPYNTMTIDEIKSIPINNLADKNCELYLWVTQKYLPISFSILNFWGFKYCQTLIWCKKPMGTGQGGIYCPTNEFIILGRQGKMPKVTRIDTTWWEVKRQNRQHSKKPEFFQDIIETVTASPRLELFARRKRFGWDVWGNEVDSDINMEYYEDF